jgi:uncharacterized protein YceH (UPF0502 family)
MFSPPLPFIPSTAMTRPLTPEEARVLAVLVEKQHTVPDSYPLSLNALTLGCNQKTARDPVMQLSEAEALDAVNGLRELSLVNEVSGNRVVRFDHNAARGLGVPSQAAALLTLLMLRGPQTAAELRLHTERLHRFADVSSVEAFLDELATKEPPRVIKLPRAPGARESRWAHLLCGDMVASAYPDTAPEHAHATLQDSVTTELLAEVASMRETQARMETEIASLRQLVTRLATELGLDTGTPN